MNRQNILLVAAASAVTALTMLAVPAMGQLVQEESPAETAAPAQFAQAQPSPAIERVVPASQASMAQSFSPVVRTTAPAVVNVYSSVEVQRSNCPYANDPFFAQFYCGRGSSVTKERVENSLGSGVIVGEDGVIVTNNHVVEAGDQFRIVLQDRREFPATLVMADQRSDLAVLKIDAAGVRFPTLSFADTRTMLVGDLVLAIGNPFGVGQTVTSGIVSALARTDVGVSDYASFIQTDASINPGNSGGALVDMQGRLVGVNTLIFSKGGGSNGIGFAIPSEMVKRVVDAAMNGGALVRPWLGAKGESVTPGIAQGLGLDRPKGVLISEIFPGGPAAKGGLRKGDLVLTIDGREVYDEKGLKFVAATKAAGESVSLLVLRDRRQQTLSVKLAAPPGTTDAELKQVQGRNPFAGSVLAELSPALAEEIGLDPFRYESGMLVYRVPRGSIASRLGLRQGDIVKEVNGAPIRTARDLDGVLSRAQTSDAQAVWRLAIERNGERIETSVRV
ncbi:MAG: Do family serine endopeptidase [Alphaproteobacteria bacterium]|nr:Do family serine endopeptidase [Alphaproteobacteria bacterium]